MQGVNEAELTRGVVSTGFWANLIRVSGTLPEDVAARPVIPGGHWELLCGKGREQQTMHLWKRWHVDHSGKPAASFFFARPDAERIVPNPNSAAVWKYDRIDRNGDGKIDFEEEMHRTISAVAIQDDLLIATDFSGLVHCLDARSGALHWTSDLLAACWGTPLIADGRVYIADEDGDVAIFRLSADPLIAGVAPPREDKAGPLTIDPQVTIEMGNSVSCSPVASDGVLYITPKDVLFAIAPPRPFVPARKP